LLAGLYFASALTSDSKLHFGIARLIQRMTGEITRVRLDRPFITRLLQQQTRLTKAYQPALRLIQLLMAGQGIWFDADQEPCRLNGFLFDMNRFFQLLLHRFLAEHLPSPLRVEHEPHLPGILAYEKNPRGRKAPVLRPDFVIKSPAAPAMIVDAKYRDLWERELPRSMLYQLAMYSLGRASRRSATILYPEMDGTATDATISIRLPDTPVPARVILRPVHLPFLDELLAAQPSAANLRVRREFALWLTTDQECPAPSRPTPTDVA